MKAPLQIPPSLPAADCFARTIQCCHALGILYFNITITCEIRCSNAGAHSHANAIWFRVIAVGNRELRSLAGKWPSSRQPVSRLRRGKDNINDIAALSDLGLLVVEARSQVQTAEHLCTLRPVKHLIDARQRVFVAYHLFVQPAIVLAHA